MTPGEIGTEAGRIFEYNLPSNWIFRSQEDQNDHGIDGEIEVKDVKGIAQGSEYVFKVQIKGEDRSTFINKNELLSFSLKTSKLRYYLSFNIPVILIVVEISSERIYWLSVTGNEDLITKASNLETETVQIHLPTKNTIKRRDSTSSEVLLKAVIRAWDHLAIQGVRSSIQRFSELDPSLLENRIAAMGNALYKAHHQRLENLLLRREFAEAYKVSGELIQSSIVPTADRFVAALFYRAALRAAPRQKSMTDQIGDMLNISLVLIELARKERAASLRLYSIGLARAAKFRYEMDALVANHNACAALADGPEGYIFRLEMRKEYTKVCLSLKKIIDLLSLIGSKGQYHIFYEIYFECAASLVTFRGIQKERGSEESIEFYQIWLATTFQFCLAYSFLSGNPERAERLYSLALHSSLLDSKETVALKTQLSNISPSSVEVLNTIEKNHKPRTEIDFLSLSTKEQMAYFRDTARHMGMDPEAVDDVMGQIVARALLNYDPTEILKNCEHLFVHYRPGGIVAQTLRLHSAGGMHLLACLKHKHVRGTGNLLSELYSSAHIPLHSFKESHCDSCLDCCPRAPDWKWSLAWQFNELPKHISFLEKFDAW